MRKAFTVTVITTLFISTGSIAATISCGGATGELAFEKSARTKNEVESVISLRRDGRATVLRYDGGIDFIGMACQQTKSGKPMLVFQAYCGGSSCRDMDNYGIIDPADLRVLLVPDDSNRRLARKILGSEPARLPHIESIQQVGEKLFPR